MDAEIAQPRIDASRHPAELAKAELDDEPRRDRRLAARARRGSQEAIRALVDRHWASTYRVAFAILGDPHRSEDVAQDALLKAIESLPRFDPRRPFAPWLHRIAANRAIDVARRAAREAVRDRVEPPRTGPPAPTLSQDLVAALRELDPELRAMFVLRHLFDYSSAELGTMFDRPAGTIRRRLAEARAQLESRLEKR